jgi:hypothetical protein
MAHYAFLDENNRVVQVIVGRNETELGIDWEQYYGQVRGLACVRTSYNSNIRGKFAGLGDYYDQQLDQFISTVTDTVNLDLEEE